MYRVLVVALHVLAFSIYAFETDDCPGACHCTMDGTLMLVDCSGLELSELPEFPSNEVHMLDLSNNQFNTIPPQLEGFEFLQYLDLSENRIHKLKSNSLKGLTTLGMLNLSKNNITNWSAINPRTFLEPAVSLRELSLANNPLTSFTTNDENLLLVSNTLQLLDLSNCKISKVSGAQVLKGMQELKHLILSGNQIRSISDLESDTLLTLDLSNNRLTYLQPTMLIGMPNLQSINLAKNYRISLQTKQGEFVSSVSLRKIDLSYCNMDNIELEGFPALTTVILKANMIRQLTSESFINSRVIEVLDLSQNSIVSINTNTFNKLKHLRILNLSFNMIPKIERDTFKENELLTKLDLSRNYISRFNRISAPYLTLLNMTWCEIMNVDPDALTGFEELTSLDLSNNLIIDLPDTLAAKNLQALDLSMNRMTAIRNTTFSGFPELTKINLSGNRFTTPFRVDFFEGNPYLSDMALGDNPWLCNCVEMYSFYVYITEHPMKIWEKQSLRCQSPENAAGRTWESVCYFTWYPQSTMGSSEKIWTFFMVTVIALSGCMCLIMTVKRAIEGRQQTARELERQRNIEEGVEIIRQNRIRMQQEAQRDAPDPRETRPPCYSDAIRMPRLDGSFASLKDFGKNRRNRKDNEEPEEEEEEVPLRRNRCRSEEVLSMRSIVVPRVHPFEVISTIEPLENNERPITESSFEEIRNFNQSANGLTEGSPYSKRKKIERITNDGAGGSKQEEPAPSSSKPVEIHDDHFKADSKGSQSSNSSGEFVKIEIKKITQVPDENNEGRTSRPTNL